MIQDKIFFDEKDPTGLSYNTPFTYFGSYQGRLWSKAPGGEIKYYTQNSDLSVYAITGSNQFNGNQAITGSLTVTGGIIGTTATSSYVEYSNVANKPTLVSGSSQVTYSGLTGIPSGIVSGSAQISNFGIFATTGSNGFNGSQSITGSLTVTGQVVAQTLNVQQVTSSIVYSSGSNIFGNSVSNTQQFTGSLQVSGSSHNILGFGKFDVNSQNTILTLNNPDNTKSPALSFAIGGSTRSIIQVNNSNSNFNFLVNSGDTTALSLNGTTGAATFSSSVRANSLNINTSTVFVKANIADALSATSVGTNYNPGILNIQNSNTTNGNLSLIGFQDASAFINLAAIGSINEVHSGSPNSVKGSLAFYTKQVGSGYVTEKMRITSGGNILIGSTSGTTLNDLTNHLSVSSTSYNLFDISRFSNNAFGPNFYLVKSRNGTIGSNTIVESGDNLGNIIWTGANGTGFTDAATIKAEVDGTPGASNDMPGRLVFSTTADGSGSPTERLRISSTGAATFTNSTSGNALRLYTSYASGRALNFGFSDGGVLPTAAFYVGNQTAVGVYIGDETTTNGLYVKANGDVGIGFTTVTNKLQVAGEITTHAGTNTQFYAYINYLGTTYNFGPGEATDNVDFKIAGGGTFTTGGNFRFFTQAGGTTPTERMRISSSGNVGIGTGFTPSYPLHVYVGVADWGAVVQNLNASSYGMYVRGGATNGSTSAFYVANTAASQLLDIKGDGRTFFTNTVTAPSFTSLSTSASIPFTTWTTVYNTDTYYGGIYLIQVGLNGASSDDWSASAIYFSGAASDMRYLVGPVNGNLVQLRKTGNSIQVYQNGTSPSVTLSIRVLKVS